MSLEGFSKVFFGPRVPTTDIDVKPQFLKPSKASSPKADAFQKPTLGLKDLHGGKWRPKPLPTPSFLVDDVAPGGMEKTGKKLAATKADQNEAEYEGPQYKPQHEKLLTNAKTLEAEKKRKEYEAAEAKHAKAEGEVTKAKAEYEKFENTAKAFHSMGKIKEAKIFSAKAGAAKLKYEQKVAAAQGAKQKMERAGVKLAKPSLPAKGIALTGEQLSGPTGLTLAKNHSELRGKDMGGA